MGHCRCCEENNQPQQLTERQKKIKKKKKKIEELETGLEKLEGRLSELQTSAFQLANYYFVFQGVILTALINKNTFLGCSDRWFLTTLSGLAAALNLSALVSIGSKYLRMNDRRSETWSTCYKLQGELSRLQQQEKQQEQVPPQSSTAARASSSRKVSEGVTVDKFDAAAHSSGNVSEKVDKFVRVMSFIIGMLMFLSFAIIVFVGCLIFPC